MHIARWLGVGAVVAGLGTAALAHDEILVVSNGSGHLHVHMHTAPPLYLDQNLPGFPGLGGFPVGLTTVFADEPKEGAYVIPATSNIVFVLTHTDPGLTMYQDGAVPMQVGDAYPMGNPFFHLHPVWTVANPTLGQSYQLRGYFRDTTGAFEDSEEFAVDFVALFAPGCSGDANGDLVVNFSDITTILANFSNTYNVGGGGSGDANNNGVVNFNDVTTTLANFGSSCNN